MSSALNSRLIGHTYSNPGDGRKLTVCESMVGLAEGFVTVQADDGSKHNENLPWVLSTIENPEPAFRTALSLLGQADRIRALATQLAAMAVSHELPPAADARLAEIDGLLEKVADRCTRDARKAKEAVAASSLSPAPSP